MNAEVSPPRHCQKSKDKRRRRNQLPDHVANFVVAPSLAIGKATAVKLGGVARISIYTPPADLGLSKTFHITYLFQDLKL